MFRNSYIDWTEFWLVIILLLGTVVLPGGLITWLVKGEQYKCAQVIETSNIPADYSWLTGCRVQRPNGMWVHIDDYYIIEAIGEFVD